MRMIDGDALINRIVFHSDLPFDQKEAFEDEINAEPSVQPEQHEIGYSECADAMLKMWIDNVLTDGEYNRSMDKLNAHWAERREE